MSGKEVLISIGGNNESLERNFLDNKNHPEIKFVEHKTHHSPYLVFIIDLHQDLTQISQRLIDTYSLCREYETKIVVVILHGKKIDVEKNHYFQKMLEDLGRDKPLHRLVFTKDIYQHTSDVPSTPLDNYIANSVIEKKINISRKGDNLFFPLSIDDFINALVKTLFLSNTAGKVFWILGDTLPDLELAYLLKKHISSVNNDEPEINANEENDPQTNSLISVGAKSRSELNWQPENDLSDDLKQIVQLYSEKPAEKEITTKTKLNPLERFLTWVYRPRPKKESHLPTVGKIVKQIGFAAVAIVVLAGGIFVATTSLSLQQLELSLKQALNGNINQSVNSLNFSIKLKEIGESFLDPFSPITNIVSPKGTEKIYNLYSFMDYSAQSLGNLHQTYVMAENLVTSLNKTDNQTNYNDLSLALHSNLSQLYENLNQIAFLSSGNKLPDFLNNKIKGNSEFKNLKTLEEQLIQFIKVTDIIPAVLSGDKVNNILVLLQNNQILRPTGGIIDYYLVLTIDKGRLISKRFYTPGELEKIYNDATASAAPVVKNKKTAAIPVIKLQDLSENPDFSIVASNLSQYLEKTLKIKPSFVIATNNLLIEQLLTQEKSPALDQFKADFVASSGALVYKDMADQYLERLFKHDLSLPVLGRTIANNIGDNQIYLWSPDSNTEILLASQSYSGVLAIHPCNASIASGNNCLTETSYLSESMPEMSRQNMWSGRQVNHTINITTNSIQHEYKIEYVPQEVRLINLNITTTYHLYLPSPSTLDQLYLNDLPSSMKDVVKVSEGSFDHYKIPLQINPYQKSSVVLKSTTNAGYQFSLPFSYSLTEYRQPGTTDSGTNLIIKYPENLRPSVATSDFTSQPSEIDLQLPLHTSTFGFTLVDNRQ